jgi:hypothetical protein
MQCPKCKFEQNDLNVECSQCGIIFSKFRAFEEQKKAVRHSGNSSKSDINKEIPTKIQWRDIFFPVPGEINYLLLGGRVLVFIVLLIWGMKFLFSSIDSNYAGRSLMHLINLPFHEAGHILFRPFGPFLTSLGGSIGQMLMPLICFATLLLKTRDAFGASVCLWWFGQNFYDLAPYINDARSGTLPLLGGNFGHSSPYGFHDWEYLLTESGLLQYDHFIAKLAVVCGGTVMIISYLWGGYVLLLQYRECK